jgi:hypothetical protein
MCPFMVERAARLVDALSKEVSAQDLNKGRGDDLLDDWPDTNAIMITSRISASRTRIGCLLLVDRFVRLVEDFGDPLAITCLIHVLRVLAGCPCVAY